MSRILATSVSVSAIALNNAALAGIVHSNSLAVSTRPVPLFTSQRVISPPGTPPTWQYPQRVRSIPYQFRDQTLVALSPDGKTVVGGDRTVLNLWDVATGQSLRTLSSFSILQTDASLSSLTFSPDGRMVAASLYEASTGSLRVNIWIVATGELRHSMERQINARMLGERPNQPSMPENWSAIAFSPDSRRLASIAGGNEQIDIWDLPSGQPIQTLRGGRGQAIAFNHDGRQLVRSSGNQILVWNLANPRSPQRIKHTGEVTGFVFSPDHKSLYVAAREAIGNTAIFVQRRELSARQQPAPLLAFHWSSTITFSPNGKTAIAGSPNSLMTIADLQTGQTLAIPNEYFSWGSATAFSQDGRTFAVTMGNQQIQIWRMGSANQVSSER